VIATSVPIDDLGPEVVHLVDDPDTGIRGATIVDNTVLGPPGGGTRMSTGLTLAELAGLARAMTYKWGVFGLPRGGSKTGVWLDPAMAADTKCRVLRGFGKQLREHMVAHEAHLGPDMGMTVADVEHIYAGAGLPYPRSGLFTQPHEGDPAAFSLTGYGVICAAREVSARLGRPLAGATVAIQGFGQVGVGCARYAAREGAKVVALSTIEGAIYNNQGLDVERLLDLRRSHGDGCLHEYRDADRIAPDQLLAAEVDVLIPAAGGRVIDAHNAGSVRATVIASGGNNTIAEESLASLLNRGVFVVPDFIASGGGIIASQVDFLRGTVDQALRAVDRLVTAAVSRLVDSWCRSRAEPTSIARSWVTEHIESSRGLPRKRFAQAMSETSELLGMGGG
jgi:glutamate dehydrogenase (NAD(P)+)